MTGVSPVTMDDLTSGFNIGTNYSVSPEFNELVGFTEEDVREMLDYNKLRMTEIYKDMKHSYIVELKYAKGKDTDDVVSRLREEAIVQANRYAETKW